MLSIATDENNDIYLDEFGNIATVSDLDAVAQVCRNTILVNLGELQYNTAEGIPYFQTVFNDPPNIELFQNAVIEALQKVEGVSAVKSFEYSTDQGVLHYTAVIQTIYGELALNV